MSKRHVIKVVYIKLFCLVKQEKSDNRKKYFMVLDHSRYKRQHLNQSYLASFKGLTPTWLPI